MKEHLVSEEKEKSQSVGYVLIGPATSGKTSAGKYLEKILSSEGIEITMIKGKDVLSERAMELCRTRNKIPDEEFVPELTKKLRELGDNNVIFENVPRSGQQASALTSWVNENDVRLEVVVLDLAEDEVVKRASMRQVCPKCDSSYHPKLKPSIETGICDNDGCSLESKPGDSEEHLRRQYGEYKTELDSILNVFENNPNIHISRINANGTVFEVSETLLNTLNIGLASSNSDYKESK